MSVCGIGVCVCVCVCERERERERERSAQGIARPGPRCAMISNCLETFQISRVGISESVLFIYFHSFKIKLFRKTHSCSMETNGD